VRPQTPAEKDVPLIEIKYPGECESKKIMIGSVVKDYLNKKKNIFKEYKFDHVFKPDSTQGQVYAEVAADVVQSVVDGYNCCIFAYGQTGAGKTYTMQGSDDTPESEGQFIEIYNDQIYDLLISHGESKDVKITHDIEEGSTRIANVKTDCVNQVLRFATKNRTVASTKMNDNSSRSHSIFMIHIKGSNSVTNEKLSGSLNLIDLADLLEALKEDLIEELVLIGRQRVRPQTPAEKDVPLIEIKYPGECESKKIMIGSVVKDYLNKKKNIFKEYKFDHVFKPDSTQGQVYAEVAADVVQSVVDGYNCCIFAYGQTGAGKTYTMQGSDDTPESEGQFIEIYNDQIYDLLISHGESKDVKITHDIEEGSTRIANVKTDCVNQVLRFATKNRTVASTKMNDNSSRSHSIFMIHIKGSNSVTNEKLSGSLNLIDLAGSEKISAYESTGDLQVETININKSLSSLKTVIQNIKENASHINYRDSTLTYVLKNSLVNISPVRSSQADTENSLEFGLIAKAAHIGIAKKG
ncbi:11686_t:CDS:2, partial [Entrophospora sp. SA101]